MCIFCVISDYEVQNDLRTVEKLSKFQLYEYNIFSVIYLLKLILSNIGTETWCGISFFKYALNMFRFTYRCFDIVIVIL